MGGLRRPRSRPGRRDRCTGPAAAPVHRAPRQQRWSSGPRVASLHVAGDRRARARDELPWRRLVLCARSCQAYAPLRPGSRISSTWSRSPERLRSHRLGHTLQRNTRNSRSRDRLAATLRADGNPGAHSASRIRRDGGLQAADDPLQPAHAPVRDRVRGRGKSGRGGSGERKTRSHCSRGSLTASSRCSRRSFPGVLRAPRRATPDIARVSTTELRARFTGDVPADLDLIRLSRRRPADPLAIFVGHTGEVEPVFEIDQFVRDLGRQ